MMFSLILRGASFLCESLTSSTFANKNEYIEAISNFERLPKDTTACIFSNLPVVNVVKISTVSKSFLDVVNTTIDANFKTKNKDGELVYDINKLYSDYRMVEQSKVLKKFIKRMLRTANTSFLSGQSISDNMRDEFFIRALFKEGPVKLVQVGNNVNDPLIGSVFKFCELKGQLHGDVVPVIIRHGLRVMKDSKDYDGLFTLILYSDISLLDQKTRMDLFNQFQDVASKSFKAMVETGNVHDTRIISSEINTLEFIYMSAIVKDLPDCEKSIELAQNFIVSASDDLIVLLCSRFLRNDMFTAQVVKLLKVAKRPVSKLSLFLTAYKDSEEIYRSVYESTEDDTITPREKIERDLLLGIEDDALIALVETVDSLEDVDPLIWIAVCKRKPLQLVKALVDRTSGRIEPLNFSVKLTISDTRHIILSENLPLTNTPEEIEALCEMGVSSPSSWLQNLKGQAYTTYLDHLLDTQQSFHFDPMLIETRLSLYDECLLKKIIRRAIATGDRAFFLSDYLLRGFEDVVEDYVREALDEGIFPENFIEPDRIEFWARCFRDAVLLETLEMPFGFISLLLGKRTDDFDLESIDFECPDIEFRAKEIIYHVLFNMVDLELGELAAFEPFREFLLKYLIGTIKKKRVEEYNLGRINVRKMKTKYPEGWEFLMERVMEDNLEFKGEIDEKFRQKIMESCSFRQVLFEVLEREGFLELM